MKIALIRRQFAPTGGAELYLQRLMTGLLKRGHELHLYCENWANPAEGIHLHEIGRQGTRSSSPVRFAENLLEQLPFEKFDCVFSLERTMKQDVYRAGDGVHAVWLEKRAEYYRLPNSFLGFWKALFGGRGKFHRNIKELERKTFSPHCTSRVIVNSEMVKSEIQQKFAFPAERIHLVRNGIEIDRFKGLNKAKCRQKWSIPPEVCLLLFVGSGWERKGLQQITNEVLPALNKNSENGLFKLLVVGKGNPRGLNKANVIFAGSSHDVSTAYGAADIFLFLPIYEPSANVCFEAMAAGLPVITSLQNGAGELIIDGRNGSVLKSALLPIHAVTMVHYWKKKGGVAIPPDLDFLSIERNVDETIEVLTLAAEERRTEQRK